MLAHGPVQCGKTHATGTPFFAWCALHWEGQDIGMSAPTWGQLEAQVMPYAQAVGDIVGGWQRKGPRKWVMPSCVGKANSFWPLVGDDARAERRAQGLLVRWLIVDEATLLPDSLLHTLLDRLTLNRALERS